MKILVANLGSTSFKYRLLDMQSETQLARGGIDRIGGSESSCSVEIGAWSENRTAHVPDHAVAVQQCLAQLTDPEHGCLQSADEVAAIGFKAVHGGRVSGVQKVTPEVLEAMTEMSPVAPAHNPPYIKAMRLLGEKLPEIPLVAAFETGFHLTIPDRNRYYAIPKAWSDEYLIQRWGFHGASHRFIGVRSAELLGRSDLRVISCHLGGSSSLCAIRAGQSMAATMGMSPQTGLPQNNRVGDFDAYILPMLMEKTGKSLEEVLAYLGSHGGLLGISGGISGDMRDLEEAAAGGNADAQLALDVYISEIRRYLGGMLVELGGADAIVFTGGIGENGKEVRAAVCANLNELGIELDATKNGAVQGESAIHADGSRTQIWVIPTNEELIVARQTKQLLES
ncbi:acetate/propionate family kinase [Blastopirellula marina]|uniref:Acetate kinase n=1 Tax=Blastopirellula marina DSM 3645 TaxID=314230 RepID=A4A2M4_9BACT|nr:acetate/propionate family kinase [Blastopirellula marina]EAQ76995.1 acetate kinase [Blastopirellula marina DSM 3645]